MCWCCFQFANRKQKAEKSVSLWVMRLLIGGQESGPLMTPVFKRKCSHLIIERYTKAMVGEKDGNRGTRKAQGIARPK